MKALLCTRFGGPDDLSIGEVPDPSAGPGQAVVRIEAAALNFFDLLIIAGKYQYKPEFPFSPGAEFAGRIESVGPGVEGFAVGERVIGYARYGAAREKIAVAAERLVKIPDGLDAERAAGLIVTYGTSYYALKDRAELQARRNAGGARRLGRRRLAAVELGKAMGARVIACASSDDKLAFAKQARRRRRRELRQRRSARRIAQARRRARHRRGVRSRRRQVRRAGAALARLVRPLSGGRLRRGRNTEAAAQPGAAEKLRRPRRVLGLMDRAASRPRIAPTWPRCCAGAPRASSAPMCMRPIRWPRRRRR